MPKSTGQFSTKDGSLQDELLEKSDEMKTPVIKNLKADKAPLKNSNAKTNITRANS